MIYTYKEYIDKGDIYTKKNMKEKYIQKGQIEEDIHIKGIYQKD